MPPAAPINALTWLSTVTIASARFVTPSDDGRVRIEVRFRDAANRGPYTYTIDADSRIGRVTHVDSYNQGITLDFEYTARSPVIAAPVEAVQRLLDGEELY